MAINKKITLEKLDNLNDVYESYDVPQEDRSVIFFNDDGTDTIVYLQHYNKDNLQ